MQIKDWPLLLYYKNTILYLEIYTTYMYIKIFFVALCLNPFINTIYMKHPFFHILMSIVYVSYNSHFNFLPEHINLYEICGVLHKLHIQHEVAFSVWISQK